MIAQPVNEPTLDWKAVIARIPPAHAIYDAAYVEFSEAEEAYNAERPAEPAGMILQLRGQTFTLEQSHANMMAEWEAWKQQDQALKDRLNFDVKEAALEAAGDAFVQTVREAMAIPAPDLQALRWKLDHLLADTPGASFDTNASLDVLKSDIARLMGDAE